MCGNMETIISTNGFQIMVDDVDYNLLSMYKWTVTKTNSNNHYAMRYDNTNGKRTKVYLHREIMQASKGDIIDHVDMNGLNCQRDNLRLSTKSKNAYNRRSWGKVSFIGVSEHKDKFRMQIYANGKRYSEVCNTAQEAALRYNEYAKRFHGDYARLNVIQ